MGINHFKLVLLSFPRADKLKNYCTSAATPCNQDPPYCQNGGTCFESINTSETKYLCQCPANTTGEQCEISKNIDDSSFTHNSNSDSDCKISDYFQTKV